VTGRDSVRELLCVRERNRVTETKKQTPSEVLTESVLHVFCKLLPFHARTEGCVQVLKILSHLCTSDGLGSER
jgi:hypothetical protein